jgi:long-subunit acyl-CoA synthetase (AMP-forming)
MAKQTGGDGSFATSDLFEPHPTLKAAWRYHSRSDSQITLVTGKKFDPSPLKDALGSSSALIEVVLIFGNWRQVPGALIFLAESGLRMQRETIRDEIWAAVDEIYRKGQATP